MPENQYESNMSTVRTGTDSEQGLLGNRVEQSVRSAFSSHSRTLSVSFFLSSPLPVRPSQCWSSEQLSAGCDEWLLPMQKHHIELI